MFRVLTLIALLLALAVIPDRVAMAADNRCEFGLTVRALTECEWQQVSPRPVDTDPCAPLTLIGTNGDDLLYGNGGDDVIRARQAMTSYTATAATTCCAAAAATTC